MPDHVKNPSRYTCYVLDEPIVVGSVNRQTGVEQAELEQVSPLAFISCCWQACTRRCCWVPAIVPSRISAVLQDPSCTLSSKQPGLMCHVQLRLRARLQVPAAASV